MTLLPQELIRKKQLGQTLAGEELADFFTGYMKGEVADYQVSALLMAIYFQGFSREETLALTQLQRDSGSSLHWPEYERALIVDKHSTGGVGDKTSLLIAPLCLLEGLKVPMIAGRGLGHTGGTLDKLEAIPGLRVFLAADEARAQMRRLGGFIMGQTPEVTPLDRRLYALRDVTSTVASPPLIVASILSKKLAEGIGSLVMDVKYGSGAFMKDMAAAQGLAETLIAVGELGGLKVRALLTNMESPLGQYAGNALEVHECLALLKGEGGEAAADTRELSLHLATHMVQLAYPERSYPAIMQSLAAHLDSGRALECFRRLAAAQGGDVSTFDEVDYYRRSSIVEEVPSSEAAMYVERVDTRRLGLAIVVLGGGRSRADASIDPQVGLGHFKKPGDFVALGEPLALVYGNERDRVDEAKRMVADAYTFTPQAIAKPPLISKTLAPV